MSKVVLLRKASIIMGSIQWSFTCGDDTKTTTNLAWQRGAKFFGWSLTVLKTVRKTSRYRIFVFSSLDYLPVQASLIILECVYIFTPRNAEQVIETAVVPVIKILADPVPDGENSGQNLSDWFDGFDEDNAGAGHPWQGSGSGMDYIPLDISFETQQHGYVGVEAWVLFMLGGGGGGAGLLLIVLESRVPLSMQLTVNFNTIVFYNTYTRSLVLRLHT